MVGVFVLSLINWGYFEFLGEINIALYAYVSLLALVFVKLKPLLVSIGSLLKDISDEILFLLSLSFFSFGFWLHFKYLCFGQYTRNIDSKLWIPSMLPCYYINNYKNPLLWDCRNFILLFSWSLFLTDVLFFSLVMTLALVWVSYLSYFYRLLLGLSSSITIVKNLSP